MFSSSLELAQKTIEKLVAKSSGDISYRTFSHLQSCSLGSIRKTEASVNTKITSGITIAIMLPNFIHSSSELLGFKGFFSRIVTDSIRTLKKYLMP